MAFDLRVLTVGLAAFALLGLAATFVIPVLASRRTTAAAARRARWLAIVRLLPAAAAGTAGLLAATSFLIFEPHRNEHIGWVLQASAIFGAAVLATALWRWLGIAFATRRLTRHWLALGEPMTVPGLRVQALAITSTFPIVAVVGIRRPTVVVAKSVLASCTPDEIQAILAHEQGHIDRRDNLRRLLIATAPDVLAWLPVSERLFAAWRAATEDAADAEAARAGTDGRLSLASALVKVARLASGPPPADLLPATSLLYRGENLEERVRRLVEPSAATAVSQPRGIGPVIAIGCLFVASVFALPNLHALLEATIHLLP